MALKKTNAGLAFLTYLVILIHVIYQVVSYIIFYYNPVVSKILAYASLGTFCAHALLSIAIVFACHDSKNIDYMGLNVRTLMQRIFAFFMCALLPTHIFSFKILSQNVGTVFFNLGQLAQILFWWSLFSHVALSFGNALITLGLLTDRKKKKITDVVVSIICIALFALTSFVIILTQRKLFNG